MSVSHPIKEWGMKLWVKRESEWENRTLPARRVESSRTEPSLQLPVVSSLEATPGPRLWRWPAAASRCLSRGSGPSWGPRAVCRSAEGPRCCDSSADTTQRTSATARRGGGTRIGVDRARWRGQRGALRTRQHRYSLIWALKHFDIIRPHGATSSLIILSATVPQRAERGWSRRTNGERAGTRRALIGVGWSFWRASTCLGIIITGGWWLKGDLTHTHTEPPSRRASRFSCCRIFTCVYYAGITNLPTPDFC